MLGLLHALIARPLWRQRSAGQDVLRRIAGWATTLAPPAEAEDVADELAAIDTSLHFVGRRAAGLPEVFAVDTRGARRLPPSPHAELDWGRPCPGTDALAHALLAAVAPSQRAEPLAEALADELLARLPHDGFVLPATDVGLWLVLQQRPAAA